MLLPLKESGVWLLEELIYEVLIVEACDMRIYICTDITCIKVKLS